MTLKINTQCAHISSIILSSSHTERKHTEINSRNAFWTQPFKKIIFHLESRCVHVCTRATHTYVNPNLMTHTVLAQGTYSNSHSVVRATLYLSLVSMYFVVSTQLGITLSWSHEGSPLYPQHPVHRTWQRLNLCGGGRSNWSSRSTAPSGLRLL